MDEDSRYADHQVNTAVIGGRYSEPNTSNAGRYNSDQATFVGRNSDPSSVYGGRRADQSTYVGVGRHGDSSIIDNGFDDDTMIGKTIGRVDEDHAYSERNYNDRNRERRMSDPYVKPSRNSGTTKIVVSGKKQRSAAASVSQSTSSRSLTVIPMTKEQYYNLPDRKTTVTVHTKVNEPAPKKTKVITVRREIEDRYYEDALGADIADFCIEMQNGPLSFRFLTCLGCIFMVVASLIDYSGAAAYYGEVSFLYSVVSIYVWIFALFVVTVEIIPFHQRPSELHIMIFSSFRLLRYSWGKALFYAFSGCLQMCLLTKWNIAAGGFMLFIAIIIVCIGRRAQSKLGKFVRKVGNRNNLDKLFFANDRDRDGYLNPEELGALVAETNVQLTFDELVSVFCAIDNDFERLVSREDLASWCSKYKAFEKRNKDSMGVALV